MKNTITIKEVYERIVSLEAKVDYKIDNDNLSTSSFKRWVYVIVTLEILNVIIHYLK